VNAKPDDDDLRRALDNALRELAEDPAFKGKVILLPPGERGDPSAEVGA
jgi:hypothetical protein